MSLNPIGGVQFLMAGGWRSAVAFALVYLAAAGFISGLLYSQTDPVFHGQLHQTLYALSGLLQVVLLLMLGPAAVRKAVQRDFQSGMIESHRLTPLGGPRLVLGYLSGAPAQIFTLTIAGLVIGAAYAVAYGRVVSLPGLMLGLWLYANLCLAFLAAMILSLTLLGALATSGKGQFIGVMVGLAVLGGGFVVFAVPGLALVLGVMSIGLFVKASGVFGLFVPAIATRDDAAVTGWAALFQILFTVLFISAAARKIRAPERALFSLPQGLTFLTLVWAALIIGHQYLGTLQIFGPGNPLQDDSAFPNLASLVAFQIAAIVPMSAAADERLRHDRAAGLALAHRRAPLHFVDTTPFVVALVGLSLVSLMPNFEMWAALDKRGGMIHASIFGALLLNSVMDYAWFYLALARRWRVLFAWAIPAVLFKALPFVAEGTLQVAAQGSNTPPIVAPWLAAAFSPFGLPTAAIRGAPLAPGVVFQTLVALGSVFVALLASASRRSGPAERTAAP